MAQDLRELFEQDTPKERAILRDGHQARFEARLDALDTQKESSSEIAKGSGLFFFMKIAAVLVVAAVSAYMVYEYAFAKADTSPQLVEQTTETSEEKTRSIQLSDLSPDFKKIEDYYLASVNVALTRLDFDDANKELVDSYMEQLAKLDAEYQRLNAEIAETGVTSEAVNAMVDNLKLRLALLSKLQKKLNELQATPEDAAQTI